MKKQELISFLEEFAPKQYAEHWDNVGFLLGKKEEELSKVYICLDVQRRSVEEAIARSCNFEPPPLYLSGDEICYRRQ